MERRNLIERLRRDLLGPRDGAREIIQPRDADYIVGSLIPQTANNPGGQTMEDEVIALGTDSGNDDDPSPPNVSFEGNRPSSLGISFSIKSPDPGFRVLATWGEYSRSKPESKETGNEADVGGLYRTPMYLLCNCSDLARWDDGRANFYSEDQSVQVMVRCSKIDSEWRVSVFLTNRRQTTSSDFTFRVHQPQIRISLDNGSDLAPVRTSSRIGDEESMMDALYRDRQTFARGHLTSVVWREIDHEGSSFEDLEPWGSWHDGDEIDQHLFESFSNPDLRTEYMPSYSILSPDLDNWPGFSDNPPELDSLAISELWEENKLSTALSPITEAYSNWIDLTREGVDEAVPRETKEIIESNLERCSIAKERISLGIKLLCDDEEARLAFLFANKAIHQANQWKNSQRSFRWRPFQLAFILMNLNGITHRDHADREVCDLLWFPTGGGKTEAYLGLAAYTIAYRRLSCDRDQETGLETGAGVGVISRYTLRLLTIQQFRRAASLVTSCERLRVERGDGGVGWRPKSSTLSGDYIWGMARFSIGLWVGSSVTPNRTKTITWGRGRSARGAIGCGRTDDEMGILEMRWSSISQEPEPAQITNCPCCDGILSFGREEIKQGTELSLHLTTNYNVDTEIIAQHLSGSEYFISEGDVLCTNLGQGHHITSLNLIVSESCKHEQLDSLLYSAFRDAQETAEYYGRVFVCFRPTRPGYLPVGSIEEPSDFSIVCPNPNCDLNHGVDWREELPSGPRELSVVDGKEANRCPIPALTVDDQIYRECPSILISTVDKFAQLTSKPEAGNIFGDISFHHQEFGFVRDPFGFQPRQMGWDPESDQIPLGWMDLRGVRIRPPDFILQDELHLIDGPLGSLVGLFELVVKELCTQYSDLGPKYISSTATSRNASEQIASLYGKKTAIFPPPGSIIDDSFWSRHRSLEPSELSGDGPIESHPDDCSDPGRLYVGLCAPGVSMRSTLVHCWSSAYHHIRERHNEDPDSQELDQFWTLVGYFNAIKELAGAQTLLGQDIPERIGRINQTSNREPPPVTERPSYMDLSSRASSTALPSMLSRLEEEFGEDFVLTTSMFGTGVDVTRLGLLAVSGQPKTTSSYIQATGRVGRSSGGLVISMFRAGRPRDLNHYEYFTGYHRGLYRHVEPVTVQPFSPKAVERMVGPAMVALLRQSREILGIEVSRRWMSTGRGETEWLSPRMSIQEERDLSDALLEVVSAHNRSQPPNRRMQEDEIRNWVEQSLSEWRRLASHHGGNLVYWEQTFTKLAETPVVLGTPAHELRRIDQVFPNSPNSMRDVESSLNFRGREQAFTRNRGR